MINMRIDIIRKELDRRFGEVKACKDSDKHFFREEVCKFMYFLLSTDGVREHIIELSKFADKFKDSDEFDKIEKEIISSIKALGKIADSFRDNVNNLAHSNNFQNHAIDYSNEVFIVLDPKLDGGMYSYKDFLKALEHFKNKFDRECINLDGILHKIKEIFSFADEKQWTYDYDNYSILFNKLVQLNSKLDAYLRLKCSYDGAESAVNLLSIFFYSEYRYLVNLNATDCGTEVENEMFRDMYGNGINIILTAGDCETLYHAVDKFLMTSKSKSALIERLKTYCRWIKRDAFPKPDEKNRENKISDIVTEFIFNHGYFPIVRPKTGKAEPDILAEPGSNVRWDNSFLIELKQYIKNKDVEAEIKRELPKDIGQAKNYYSIVKPYIDDTVHLLVFYNGKKRFRLDDSYPVEDNIQVEFIYVGDITPSKLKTVIIK